MGVIQQSIGIFTYTKIINLYIVFEIKLWPYYNDSGFALKRSLVGGVKLTKTPDPGK